MDKDTNAQSGPPDVEAIIGQIRNTVRQAEAEFSAQTEVLREGPSVAAVEDGLRAENNLYDNLAALNKGCRVGALPDDGGLKGQARLKLYAMLRPLVEELNGFHISVARTLNKLVRILDGQDTQVASELLLKTQQRVDLLSQLCDRLSQYDDLKIDERLRQVEERLRDSDAKGENW